MYSFTALIEIATIEFYCAKYFVLFFMRKHENIIAISIGKQRYLLAYRLRECEVWKHIHWNENRTQKVNKSNYSLKIENTILILIVSTSETACK